MENLYHINLNHNLFIIHMTLVHIILYFFTLDT